MAKVKLPGVGPVDSRWLIAGGALLVGIVGFAWWRAGGGIGGGAAVAPEELDDAAGVADREPPATGDSNASVDNRGPGVYSTNAEWTQAAVLLMADYGYPPDVTSRALGKYLARQPLDQTEEELVLTARGVVGDAPVGGPYPITRALPTPPASSSPPPASSSPPADGIAIHRIGTVGRTYNIRAQALRFATKYWQDPSPNSVEVMVRELNQLNPDLKGKTSIPGGFALRVPRTKSTI